MVTALSKEIVRVYTDGGEGEELGHFVKCNDCAELQLISKSKKKCERCGSEKLEWVKEDMKVVTPEDIQGMGYNLEFVI